MHFYTKHISGYVSLHYLVVLILLPSLFTSLSAQPESPYYLSLKREFIYGAAGLSSVGAGRILRSRTPDIVLSNLRLRTIPRYDLIATHQSSRTAKKLSNYTLYGSLALPTLLVVKQATRRDAAAMSILYFETLSLTLGLTDIIKSSALRPRPYVFDEDLPASTVINDNDRAAFLSGHTSISAASGIFFARAFSDYYPDSKLKPYAWLVGTGVPALTGYLRVRAGQHYPSDVVAGYLLGASTGYLIPLLHRRPIRIKELTVSPMGAGFHLSYKL